jgi:hypothetical protein
MNPAAHRAPAGNVPVPAGGVSHRGGRAGAIAGLVEVPCRVGHWCYVDRVLAFQAGQGTAPTAHVTAGIMPRPEAGPAQMPGRPGTGS